MPFKVIRINPEYTPLLDKVVEREVQRASQPRPIPWGRKRIEQAQGMEVLAPGLYREAGKHVWKVEKDENGETWLSKEDDLSVQSTVVEGLRAEKVAQIWAFGKKKPFVDKRRTQPFHLPVWEVFVEAQQLEGEEAEEFWEGLVEAGISPNEVEMGELIDLWEEWCYAGPLALAEC